MNQPFRYLMLAGCLGWFGVCGALAQARPPAEKVYSMSIGQLPELPSGGGLLALSTAIQRHVHYPPRAEKNNVEGRVFVGFTVSSKGIIHSINVIKSLSPDCDSAVMKAVQLLPRLKPGREAGKPVAVRFTVPVSFRLEETEEAKGPKPK